MTKRPRPGEGQGKRPDKRRGRRATGSSRINSALFGEFRDHRRQAPLRPFDQRTGGGACREPARTRFSFTVMGKDEIAEMEHQVRRDEEHVSRQREIVGRLKRLGDDDGAARALDLLATFEDGLRIRRADLARRRSRRQRS